MNGLGLNDPDESPRENGWPDEPHEQETPIISTPFYEPESQAESARKMGLGYAAGITFFATVAFMIFIGWGADLILGTKPWGVVVGIVLGAVMAFVQFFRITNRIYNKPKDLPAVKPLSPEESDDQTY
ncbi:MAG: AtpZ/AtpI family protein [Acidobacteria bacterium]|nr:AtpZ/AtpI family protein [Acidobacteriota bacterium]